MIACIATVSFASGALFVYFYAQDDPWETVNTYKEYVNNEDNREQTEMADDTVVVDNPPAIKKALWKLVSRGEVAFMDRVLTDYKAHAISNRY